MTVQETEPDFWRNKTLDEMTAQEWESLCDGCGQCCMIKLQDEANNRICTTAVVCDLLDLDTCRCTRYPQRIELVPDCVELNSKTVHDFTWLPESCGYRRVAAGQDLPMWHPLISGNRDTVVSSGASVIGRVLPESQVHEDDYEQMIVRWIDP